MMVHPEQVGSSSAGMQAREVVPILNVANLVESFAWFSSLGWSKAWEWCPPGGTPSFGAVVSGTHQIFLCLNGQGGRARASDAGSVGEGTWMSVWVDDVDAVQASCTRARIEVIRAPRDEPWGVREMHVRHPDGHVLRISQNIHTHAHEHLHDHPRDHAH